MRPRVWGPLAGRSIWHYISGSLTVCKSLILRATKEESAMRRTMNRSHIRGGCNSSWRKTTKCLILPLVRFVFIWGAYENMKDSWTNYRWRLRSLHAARTPLAYLLKDGPLDSVDILHMGATQTPQWDGDWSRITLQCVCTPGAAQTCTCRQLLCH